MLFLFVFGKKNKNPHFRGTIKLYFRTDEQIEMEKGNDSTTTFVENCIFCNLIQENDPIKIPEKGTDYSIIKGTCSS